MGTEEAAGIGIAPAGGPADLPAILWSGHEGSSTCLIDAATHSLHGGRGATIIVQTTERPRQVIPVLHRIVEDERHAHFLPSGDTKLDVPSVSGIGGVVEAMRLHFVAWVELIDVAVHVLEAVVPVVDPLRDPVEVAILVVDLDLGCSMHVNPDS